MSLILTGFLGSLAAGAATGVGALPILKLGMPDERRQSILLGFAAGVMLAASFFSLILPGIAQGQASGMSPVLSFGVVGAAVLLGGVTLALTNVLMPPLDRFGLGPEGIAATRFRRIWLFVAAITLHNFPEGMAVGVSFGGGDFSAGLTTAIGIGLQNMPEGLAVAGAVASLGYSRRAAFGTALLSGLVEPVAGLMGAALVSLALSLLPWGLGFAAGAMIYIVVSEIIPDVRREVAVRKPAMASLMTGLVIMMALDLSLT
ncbi:ZIP family metal transporter [Allosphingosinicella vermicomposti]|uniref:ZIP family metal transporter n=1 Tax=Allosphingosinicella vermicomposti TaxID=614671 RepID=UPI000D102206|nr:ZIP family metal transporter [Allosphingosinicella vermicomposti]